MKALYDSVKKQLAQTIAGQDEAIGMLIAAASLGGHVLLEGVPGVAKTLLANALARSLGLDFRRVQLTPDMLPSDLTGNVALRSGELVFRPGPLFTNLVLADEINRTPPKTQAALLEAMQEHQVTVDGVAHALPDPFIVVATQNPIEYEGTYPLPEAQLDRFLFKLEIGYPSAEQEIDLLGYAHKGVVPSSLNSIQKVSSVEDLIALRELVDATTVSGEVLGYVSAVIRKTRELPSVTLGASPRAAVHLLAASKAVARLNGRDYVSPDDVVHTAPAVLRHRLILSPEAELERYRPDDAVTAALNSVPVPR